LNDRRSCAMLRQFILYMGVEVLFSVMSLKRQ
jgi:hypothetical protein